MAFGIPYMGSKSIYATKILEALPSGTRLVDLFAGGCAITDCAMRRFDGKWRGFVANDINPKPLELYEKALKGEPFDYSWVTRDQFKASNDFETRLVWSFGNNTINYIYGRDIEHIKHDIEEWIVNGVILHHSDIFERIKPPSLNTMEERKRWCKSFKCKSRVLSDTDRIDRLQRLESLQRLELMNASYQDYKYQTGDIVYCDIPYYKTGCNQYKCEFSHKDFIKWARAQDFDVYVSERHFHDFRDIYKTFVVQNRFCRGNKGYKTEVLLKL